MSVENGKTGKTGKCSASYSIHFSTGFFYSPNVIKLNAIKFDVRICVSVCRWVGIGVCVVGGKGVASVYACVWPAAGFAFLFYGSRIVKKRS